MKRLFSLRKFKKASFDEDDNIEAEDEYVELNTDTVMDENSQVVVRPFVIEDFSDIKQILEVLREGYTICLINIKALKEKDLVELKRAINKLKKTCDAIEGDIAGFGDDYIVVVPSFASIHRSSAAQDTLDE